MTYTAIGEHTINSVMLFKQSTKALALLAFRLLPVVHYRISLQNLHSRCRPCSSRSIAMLLLSY